MHFIDFAIFAGFVATVIGVGLWKSRGEELRSEHGAQDYFLAGRGLTWWLVGFSLIAANISTEQFVGMSGKACDWLGVAIASYEWIAAITLVVVAFVFLPKFLKSGIYTIPEFLEYRYNTFARTVMAISTMIILVGVPTASVIFSGAKVVSVFFKGTTLLGLDLGNITIACWLIGVMAAIYVFAGGLKACAWADLIQGAALILGGVIIAVLAMQALGTADPTLLIASASNVKLDAEAVGAGGAVTRLLELNADKLHMVRPADDPEIPWTALVIGIWIPNFFYWGLNQYITQRTLGSRSLDEGQKGVVFAAFLKLLIPFVVVIPGILAFNLFRSDLKSEAIGTNAQVFASTTPGLYERLSAGVKPDPRKPENRELVKEIKSKLAKARAERADEALTVYEFNEEFAALHPEDAAAIVAYNRTEVGSRADLDLKLPERPTAAELATVSAAQVRAARGAITEGLATPKLVGYDHDAAFPTLLKNLLRGKSGILGFVLAAIFGAVVSSLASMLNSASTIFTMDIYNKVKRRASQFELVTVGRICTIVFVLVAMVIAPSLGSPKFGGIFTFIQEFQGFISPGILAVFVFGLLVRKAPRMVGTVGLVLNPALYGLFKVVIPEVSFLNRMTLCFGIVCAVLTAITLLRPLKDPIVLPVNEKMSMATSRSTKFWGLLVVLLTVALYVIFW